MTASRWLLLVLTLVVAAILAIAIGTISVPISAIADALRGDQSTPAMVVRSLRIPRVVLASLVGAGLGMSGAAL